VIQAVRRALALLDRRDRWLWLALIPLAAVAAVVEAAGAAAVFLLVRVLSGVTVSVPAPSRLIAWLLPASDAGIIRFAVVLVGFYAFRNVVLIAVQFAQERVIQRTASQIAVALFARFLSAPYAFHFRRSSSSLIHAIRDTVDTAVENVLAAAVHIASECLVVAALLAILASTAPAETTAAVAAILILLVAPLGLTRRLYARWGDDERRTGERMIAHLQQALDAVKAIAVTGRQSYFARRYAQDRAALEQLKLRRALGSSTLRLGVETVFIAAMLLAVVLQTAAGRSGPEALSVLSLFAYAGFRVVPSANRVILNVNMLRFGRPYVDALVSDWRELMPATVAVQPSIPTLSTAIECRSVSYAYANAPQAAIDRVSFTIPRGASVGIVGPTGAGKSTIVDIVLGLLTPTAGQVLVDGRDIASAGEGWRAQVGYVPQDVMVIDDTLRRNIAFGIDDGHIDARRIDDVVRRARLEALVASVPGGLDAPMGERGIRLSGGERQRIAIARALYHDPAVLVFDEATSALDAQTEQEIADAIDRARGERTVLVIAHRLTTVRRCDSIIVLNNGRLVGQGGYDELLRDSEPFRALARAAAEL
jgi:ABC-type multidrug transport system fused ATPase/permease subunit